MRMKRMQNKENVHGNIRLKNAMYRKHAQGHKDEMIANQCTNT